MTDGPIHNGVVAADGGPPIDMDRARSAMVAAINAAVAEELTEAGVAPRSPEARRVRAERMREAMQRGYAHVAPGSRPFEVAKRVLSGTYFDGFMHAGNLAYLALIALFPFIITAVALATALGEGANGTHALISLIEALPPSIGEPLMAPVREVLAARTGVLLWLGAVVGLWTVGSLIETIRDILRRAYGTRSGGSFWRYRLMSIGIIIGSVLLLLISVSAQVLLVGIEEVLARLLPDQFDATAQLLLSQAITVAGLFLSLYLLFLSLTPGRYRPRRYPKWPGALATTLWSVGVTQALPPLLGSMLAYDLTYGSLAGVMIVLFFFYLIGLGVVIGAELNAALAESPAEEQERLAAAGDRARLDSEGNEPA